MNCCDRQKLKVHLLFVTHLPQVRKCLGHVKGSRKEAYQKVWFSKSQIGHSLSATYHIKYLLIILMIERDDADMYLQLVQSSWEHEPPHALLCMTKSDLGVTTTTMPFPGQANTHKVQPRAKSCLTIKVAIRLWQWVILTWSCFVPLCALHAYIKRFARLVLQNQGKFCSHRGASSHEQNGGLVGTALWMNSESIRVKSKSCWCTKWVDASVLDGSRSLGMP